MEAQNSERELSEPTSRVATRACPTIEGRHVALITHAIAPGACLQRQREQYHKCHRCVYRGKAASFEFAPAASRNGASRNGNGLSADG